MTEQLNHGVDRLNDILAIDHKTFRETIARYIDPKCITSVEIYSRDICHICSRKDSMYADVEAIYSLTLKGILFLTEYMGLFDTFKLYSTNPYFFFKGMYAILASARGNDFGYYMVLKTMRSITPSESSRAAMLETGDTSEWVDSCVDFRKLADIHLKREV